MREVRFVMKTEDDDLIYVVGRASFVERDEPTKILDGWGVPDDELNSPDVMLGAEVVAATF